MFASLPPPSSQVMYSSCAPSTATAFAATIGLDESVSTVRLDELRLAPLTTASGRVNVRLEACAVPAAARPAAARSVVRRVRSVVIVGSLLGFKPGRDDLGQSPQNF